ncbi:FHA domain-containing protein [Frankia sp. CNm7]|uniref:FHA domain-containing protein n=1 Tax=Frankia nepalensis TaxID=1836974 RepID=A0A937RAC5_9ACTN|nr:FHA domain-containing protein [Frankia nepalensis]MBL7494891.1 FHA domain-containing protein [Frankia nepalensis]MBL7515648.1 FHA domain-containing protein [Frankia nepalensis]MBL7521182.1 FHA domain-containing protein [Frankia nepalensis]MBL7626662.1 FHA domain-containing protein [Frankia nepalensis]
MDPTQPSELVLLLVKIGYLTLLWAFVLLAVRAVRADLFDPARRRTRRGVAVGAGAQGAGPIPHRPRPAQPRPAAPAPSPPNAPNAYPPSKVVVTKGPLAGTVIPLTGEPITIGRAPDSTLVLDDDFASGRHARLVPHEGRWFVEDLNSTNGTFLEHTKVTTPMPVPLGAPVRIGKTVLELRR